MSCTSPTCLSVSPFCEIPSLEPFLLSNYLSAFFSPLTSHLPKIPNPSIAKRVLSLISLAALLIVCYTGWAYHLDLQAIRHLDDLGFWRPEHVKLGAKTIDRFGRMKRSSGVPTVCGKEYSEYVGCVANAQAQANCLPICTEASTCHTCPALSASRQSRFDTLLAACDERAAATIPLNIGQEGHYNYILFSAECMYIDSSIMEADSWKMCEASVVIPGDSCEETKVAIPTSSGTESAFNVQA